MRTRFKNIRKVPSKIRLVLSKPPPIKKLRLEIKHPAASQTIHASEQQSLDTVTYNRHIEYMKRHPVQNNRIEVALKIMKETRSMRIRWIRNSKPQVPAILEQFPYLRNSKIVGSQLPVYRSYCVYYYMYRSWKNLNKLQARQKHLNTQQI